MGPSPAWTLTDTIGIIPILRAGLGMAEGVLELIPDAQVWHVGLYRDEHTLRPMEYYKKLPTNPKMTIALVVDPMLATGGSAVHACSVLKAAGIRRLKLISLIAAPEGIARMQEAMPDVPIHGGRRRPPQRGRIHLPRAGRRRGSSIWNHTRLNRVPSTAPSASPLAGGPPPSNGSVLDFSAPDVEIRPCFRPRSSTVRMKRLWRFR